MSKRHAKAPAPAPAAKAAERPQWIPYAIAAIPLLIFLWAYAPVLNAPFLFDDTNQQYDLPDAKNPLRAWIGPVRPVLMFTYWANVQISRTDTYSFHVLNLAIHAAAAFFVFLVIRRLLEWAGSDPRERVWLAGFGASLFLLHPIQTESVAYIAGRSESLSGMFAMACLAAFFYRRSTAISWTGVAIVLLLFGLAMFSKEQAIVAPAVLLLADFWWNPGFSLKGIFGNWKLYGLMAAGGVAGVAVFWQLIHNVGTGGSAGFGLMPWYQYLFTEFRALWVYVLSFVYPANLNIDWEFPISRSLFDHGAIVGLIALAGAGVAVWRYRERFRLATFGYLMYLTFLLPTSTILPIADPVADRRMYVPMVGLTLIVLDILPRWHIDRRMLAAVGCVILLAMAVVTHARAEVWSDPITLWQDSVAKSPDKYRPHFQLAQSYTFAQRNDLAIPEYEKAAALSGPRFDLLLDMGLAYDAAQQFDKAIEKLRQAVALAQSASYDNHMKDAAHAQTQIAKVYADQRDWPRTLEALDAAEKYFPNFPTIYAYRGLVHLANNDADGGIRECRRALAIDPGFQPAQECVNTAQRMGGR